MTNKNEISLIVSTALATNIAVDGGAILGAFISTLNIKEDIWKTT